MSVDVKNIVKKEQMYEGKAKKVFATNNPDYVIMDYKDSANNQLFPDIKKQSQGGVSLARL